MKNNKKLVIAIIAIVACVAAGILIYLNKDINFGKRNENANPIPAKENQELKLVKYGDFNYESNTQIYYPVFDDEYITFEKYNDLTDKSTIGVIYKGKEINVAENLCPGEFVKIDGKNDLYACYDEDDNARLINYKRQDVGQYVYSYVEPKDRYHGFVSVVKDDEYEGLLDSQGYEVITPEYEAIEVVKTTEGNIYFIVDKDDDIIVLDENKNEVFKTDAGIWYSDYYNKFYTLFESEDDVIKFYSLNGEVIKEFNREELSLGEEIDIYYDNYITNGMLSFVDATNPSTTYIIDDKLNINKYENVLHKEETSEFYGEEGHGFDKIDTYYITDGFIAINENDKNVIKSLSTGEILGEYTSIDYIYIPYGKDDSKSIIEFFVACKENNKCGIIDSNGNKITDFIYEYNKETKTNIDDEEKIINILKNDDEYVLIPQEKGNAHKMSCSSFYESADIVEAEDYFFVDKSSDEEIIYNYQCEKLVEDPIWGYKYYDDGLLIIEQDLDFTDDDKFIFTYEIFYNGKKLEYKNEDNAKIHQLLGYNDKKIYFVTDKGIYFLDIN